MDKIWWIVIIIFAAAFLWWIYRDGKLNHLMEKKIKDYRAPEILILSYLLLITFSFVIGLLHLLF